MFWMFLKSSSRILNLEFCKFLTRKEEEEEGWAERGFSLPLRVKSEFYFES